MTPTTATRWNLLRNYARTLTVFKAAPGKEGNTVVPDLATDLGKSSDGGKTWTYTIHKGVKFEDGTPVTTKDIKYAVSRTFDTAELEAGPAVLRQPAGVAGGLQGTVQGSEERRHLLGDRDP